MIYASATSLANSLNYTEEEDGWLYPDLSRIRDISASVAVGVIRAAQEAKVDREVRIRDMDDEQLEQWVKSRMYDPHKESQNVEREIKSVVRGINGNGSHL